MANTIQDELYRTFVQVSGQQATALSSVTSTLADVVAQVQEVRAAMPAANGRASSLTSASSTNQIQPQSSEGVLSTVASTVLKSGFGLAPLVGGLISLFGEGASEAPAPLIKYAMPPAVDFEAAQDRIGTGGVDYDQSGMPRVYKATRSWTPQAAGWSDTSVSAAGGGSARPAPQITVNVQAMDARSFLDRSNDIALAVRDAMLNMNAINDVVSEL